MTQPIICDISAYKDFGFVKLTTDALRAIEIANELAKPHIQRQMSKISRCLECFLQITDGPSLGRRETWAANQTILAAFIDALKSPMFLKAERPTRYTYVSAGTYLVCQLGGGKQDESASILPRPDSSTSRVKFPHVPLNERAVALWRAWPIAPLDKSPIWLPLFDVHKAHGPEVAARLHQVCATYATARRLQKIPGAKQLFSYISRIPSFRFENFQTANASRSFFDGFYDFYAASRRKTCKPQTVLNDWTMGFAGFAESALIGTGLFAAPAGGMPGPQSDTNENSRTDKSLEKLLLPVPPELGTYEALGYVRESIPKALEIVSTWATAHAQNLYDRVKQRRRFARFGTARLLVEDRSSEKNSRQLVNRDNPSAYANACATYERYGHLSREDYKSLQILFPDDLARVTHELGLPSSGALLPHATLLVREHPEIVPSFLESLELWNTNGKLIGLVRQNRVTYLVGYKHRGKGKRRRKQIALTKKSLRLVIEVLRITSNLRKYLQKKGDPSWRYLFLTCGKGFDYPERVARFATFTSGKERATLLVNQFLASGCKDENQARLLAKQFSLRSVRTTRALCTFVETHSEVEMAKALGHARLSRVLNRYLPKEIAGFLRIRWMRAFQTRMVIHMTQNTPYMLIASGLQNMTALDTFLEHHPFPDIDSLTVAYEKPSSTKSSRTQKEGTFVVNASVNTLTLLTNIVRAVDEAKRPVTSNAKYWSCLSQHVLSYVRAQAQRQPAFARALCDAESKKYSFDLTKAIYA
ncbi:hypothetical protein [Burkholderia glumae]